MPTVTKKHAKAAAATLAKKDDRRAKNAHRKQVARSKDYYDSSDEKAFLALLNGVGLTIKYMDGDGNCLFRSVADQLTGNADGMHMDVRRKVMDYIAAHKDHFSLFIEDDEPFDDYVERMRETREWGGDKELYAASQLFAVNVVVHQADAARPRYVLQCDRARRDIHVSYHGECHYNSVRGIADAADGARMGPAAEIRLAGLDTGLSTPLSSASASSSSAGMTAAEQAVLRCVPWHGLEEVRKALRRAGGDEVDVAVELLMLHPDGLGDEENDEEEEADAIEGDEADNPEMPPPLSPAPAPAPADPGKKDTGPQRKAPVRALKQKVVVTAPSTASRKDRRRQAKDASLPPPPPQQAPARATAPPATGVIYL